jgi:hypothetical protein
VASPHDGAEEPRTWCRDIEVRYCQDAWQVRGERLGNDLVFRELIDAERLAVALGRRRSCDVAIYDRNDRLATRHATGWPQLGHRLAGAGIANEG